ncbi:MAG: LexA family protein [Patescibacteria group bacterium]
MYSINIKIKTKLINRIYNFCQTDLHNTKNKLAKNIKKFCVRIAGESMINAGLYPGSVVEIAKGINAQHNDIILAKLDGVHTIKRLYIDDCNNYMLMPENFDYDPIEIAPEDDFEIEGIVFRVVE